MSTYDIVTQAIGIVAMSMIIFSFQCKKTRNFYIMQGAGGLLFALNFFMLGMYTGAVTNLINILRSGIMCGGKKSRKWYVLLLMMSIYVAATIFTYDGWPSLILLVAQITGVLTMWTDNGTIIRIGQFFVVSPIWMTYNIHAKSIGGIICEVFTVCSIIVYVLRCLVSKFLNKSEEN